MDSPFELHGKTVLITGGAGGIGLSLAKLCLHRNASTVMLADLASPKLDSAKAHLAELFPHADIQTHGANLTTESNRLGVYNWIIQQNIRPYFLVNCLGTTYSKPFEAGSWNEMRHVLTVNIHALVHMCQLFIPEMIAQGEGAILNISSTSSKIPCPGMLCYSATKAFINNFSETLAIELEPHNIRVKFACPGATDTGFFKAAGMENLDYVRKVRKMRPDDVAIACLKLMASKRIGSVIGLKNKFNMFLVSLLPWRIRHAVISRRFR